jgi:hypothetical protein
LSRHDDPTRQLLAPRKRDPVSIPPKPSVAPRRRWLAPLGFSVLVAAGIGFWLVRSDGPPPAAVAPQPTSSSTPALPTAPAASAPQIALASLTELLRAPRTADWRVRRFRDNSAILIVEFPGLDAQGSAMNRVAAMYEKRDGDRERVLTDAQMDRLLRSSGDSVASFVQGHDYTGEMLARFFTLAPIQQVMLNDQEKQLRALLVGADVIRPEPAGAFKAIGTQAVVSFTSVQADDPTTPADESVDARRRESVLRHELSHGQFFTNAKYRAYCWDFWRHRLSAAERKLFRRYLEGLDYNPRDEELMVNEMQAMLMHTPDSRAFNAAALGVSPAVLDGLRGQFHPGDPLMRPGEPSR